MVKKFNVGMAWPFTFIRDPSRTIEVHSDRVVLIHNGSKSVQPINSTSRWSLGGRSLCLDTNCDLKAGPFCETVYRNVQNFNGFCDAIAGATNKGPYGG